VVETVSLAKSSCLILLFQSHSPVIFLELRTYIKSVKQTGLVSFGHTLDLFVLSSIISYVISNYFFLFKCEWNIDFIFSDEL